MAVMRRQTVPQHPKADRSKDSIIMEYNCRRALDVLQKTAERASSPRRRDASARARTTVDAAYLKDEAKRAILQINQGQRPSKVFVHTVDEIRVKLSSACSHKARISDHPELPDAYLGKVYSYMCRLRDVIAYHG
jgi:hypothetical protein